MYCCICILLYITDTAIRINPASAISSLDDRIKLPPYISLKQSLKQHQADQAVVSQTRKFVCNLCGKSQISLAHLRRHMITHSSQRNFVCNFCGETYKHKSSLVDHVKGVVNVYLSERKRCITGMENDFECTYIKPLLDLCFLFLYLKNKLKMYLSTLLI